MLFFWARLNILIFLPILACKYSCIILELSLKKKEFIVSFLGFVHFFFFFAVYYSRAPDYLNVCHVAFIELSLALNIWL